MINVQGFEWGRAMLAIDAYSETAKLLDKYYPCRSSKVPSPTPSSPSSHQCL